MFALIGLQIIRRGLSATESLPHDNAGSIHPDSHVVSVSCASVTLNYIQSVEQQYSYDFPYENFPGHTVHLCEHYQTVDKPL